MAKSNSRYIQFYTPGSVAYKVELRQEQEWAPLPKAKPAERRVISIDPVAVIGCVVAVCMLLLMAVGIQQLNQTRREVAVLENYVAQLTAQNQELTRQYKEGYELNAVRQKALDMGMIPVEDVPETTIDVEVSRNQFTQQTALQSRWKAFTSSLFA